jgi:hypothetical protein
MNITDLLFARPPDGTRGPRPCRAIRWTLATASALLAAMAQGQAADEAAARDTVEDGQ